MIIYSIFRIYGYPQVLFGIEVSRPIMKKLAKRSYKGIEYVRLDSVPKQLADSLVKSLNPRTLVKIQMYDETVEDCVLYEAYEKWYANYLEEASLQTAVVPAKSSVSLS